jgi:hypothetical protein
VNVGPPRSKLYFWIVSKFIMIGIAVVGGGGLVDLAVTGCSNNVVFTISIRYRHFLEYLNSGKLISTV